MTIYLPTNERSAIGQPSPSNCSYLILNPGTWWASMKDGFTAMPAELRAGNKFGSPDLTSSVKRLPSRGAITAWFSSLLSSWLKCPPQYLSWLASCRKPVDEAAKTYSNWRRIFKWQHLFCWLRAESPFVNETESYLLSDGLETKKCLGINLCRDIFFTSSSLINFFGAILDQPSPPKIGHHLCTFPNETVTYY